MRRIILSIVMVFGIWSVLTGNSWYGDSLQINYDSYDVIVHLEKYQLTIYQPGQAELSVTLSYLVRNRKGLEQVHLIIEESRYARLISLSGQILDGNRKKIKKIEKKDFIKANISEAQELGTDATKYFHAPESDQFPVYVEYTYKMEISSLFGYNRWMVRGEMPVREARYMVQVPISMGMEYKTPKIKQAPNISREFATKTYTWVLKHIQPFPPKEKDAPPESLNEFSIRFSPSAKMVEDNIVSMESWMKMTEWMRKYYYPEESLPGELIGLLDSLKKTSFDEKEFIRRWYRLAVEKTRYLIFSPGILGWVPLSCKQIWYNKYGDCKNLTHLITQGLRHAGIRAYPALALTRNEGVIDTGFVVSQFNHVIGVVFLNDDTLFLESTSDILEAGQLGWTDEGINVLVLQPDTVFFIRTPESKPEENYWIGSYDVYLEKSGDFTIKGRSVVSGNYANKLRATHAFDSDEEIRKSFYKSFNSEFPIIEEFQITTQHIRDSYDQPIIIETAFRVRNYTRKNFPRMFLNPAMIHSLGRDDMPEKTREFPVFFWFRNLVADTIRIHIPEDYHAEAIPSTLDLEYPFGEYSYRIHDSGNLITLVRVYKIKERIIAWEEYDDFRTFFQKIIRQDGKDLVLIRKES